LFNELDGIQTVVSPILLYINFDDLLDMLWNVDLRCTTYKIKDKKSNQIKYMFSVFMYDFCTKLRINRL